MPKKTDKDLGALFDMMTDSMIDILQNGEEVVTKDGEVIRVAAKASTLSVVRQFLKDNQINADMELHPKLKELKTEFDDSPFNPNEDDEIPTYQ